MNWSPRGKWATFCMLMKIFPAIDLKGGRVVRLSQGRADQETVYENDPAKPAEAFRKAGAEWVHVVDLDGAFTGHQANASAVEAILKSGLKVELGGGIRSLETIQKWLDLGVQRVVIGTRAVTDPNFLNDCLRHVPPENVAVGIDAMKGKVAVRGWIEVVDLSAIEFARTVQEMGVQTLIYTDISRDGMMTGPNLEAQQEMLEEVEIKVIASGGISSLEDIRKFCELAAAHPNLEGVITGRALYDGTLDLAKACSMARECA